MVHDECLCMPVPCVENFDTSHFKGLKKETKHHLDGWSLQELNDFTEAADCSKRLSLVDWVGTNASGASSAAQSVNSRLQNYLITSSASAGPDGFTNHWERKAVVRKQWRFESFCSQSLPSLLCWPLLGFEINICTAMFAVNMLRVHDSS